MINPERWILVEAWLSLGLRVRWARSYETASATLQGENQNLWYAGHEEWVIVVPHRAQVSGQYGEFRVPEMSTDDMRHELAHWLSSTPEERNQVNFGSTETNEERAVMAEHTIDAIVRAAGRIATLALLGEK